MELKGKNSIRKIHIKGLYLTYNECRKSTVKAIAFKNGIPKEAKASLAEAIAARKDRLTIKYFP